MVKMTDRMETTRGKRRKQREEQVGIFAPGQTGSPPCSSFSGLGWEFPAHTPIQLQHAALPVPLLGRAGAYFHQTGLKISFLAPRNAVQTTQDRIYVLLFK